MLTSGDSVKASFLFANFGGTDIPSGEIIWTLRDAHGKLSVTDGAIGNARKIAETRFTAPDVAKPEKAVLTASLATATNSWEFWIFPKRTMKDGSGIAVEKSLMPALAKLYSGLVPVETADAPLVIAPFGSKAAADALAKGKTVVTIHGTKSRSNISLGWWAMGDQVGTAFKSGDPALGMLPHEGYLSPLMFRFVKNTARKLPFNGMNIRDMTVAGEGGNACFLYLGSANIDKGKAVMAFGLDLLSGTPEGTCILDGMIETAQRADFAPQGRVAMPVVPELNGWAKTLAFGDANADDGPRLCVARGMTGKNTLEWQTKPLPTDLRNKPTFAISWAGGMGYPGQPVTTFTLSLNDKVLFEIPGAVWENTKWNMNGCELSYVRDEQTKEYGVFALTVPSELLEPGQPVTLKVAGSASNSFMWMGVFE